MNGTQRGGREGGAAERGKQGKMRDRQTDRHRERKRDRDRERQGQRDRQTDRDREIDRDAERGDRQGENAVGGGWGELEGGKTEGGLREDIYASRCLSFSLTDLNNTGDCGEGNSDVATTTLFNANITRELTA